MLVQFFDKWKIYYIQWIISKIGINIWLIFFFKNMLMIVGKVQIFCLIWEFDIRKKNIYVNIYIIYCGCYQIEGFVLLYNFEN